MGFQDIKNLTTLSKCGTQDHVGSNDEAEYCYYTYTYSGVEQYALYRDWHPCYDSWVLLPGFNFFSNELRIVIYFLFLCYLFLGIAIISDVFMSAIEVITSKEKTVKKTNPKTGEIVEYKVMVWNATVANLTLMALGSSAPEILLACIEAVMQVTGQGGSDLGPATIVGSASFNLLAITAVCMVSVPDGEVRRISELPVFLVTAFFSLWAYIWLLIVYEYWTPGVITIAEAVITALKFPLLVGIAYAADQGFWMKKGEEKDPESGNMEGGDSTNPPPPGFTKVTQLEVTTEGGGPPRRWSLSNADIASDRKQIAKMMRNMEKEEDKQALLARIMADHQSEQPERNDPLKYRINAVRGMVGKHHKVVNKQEYDTQKVHPDDESNIRRSVSKVGAPTIEELADEGYKSMFTKDAFLCAKHPVFAFNAQSYAVMEGCGTMKATVLRGGSTDCEVSVEYYTEDGTATTEDNDYRESKGQLIFKKGETEAFIEVAIIDDNQYEPDEYFTINLVSPSDGGDVLTPSVEVTIIDDDEPGMFQFAAPIVECTELAKKVTLEVKRLRGSDGKVAVEFETQDGTAISDVDYEDTKGVLEFDHGEASGQITVKFPPEALPEVQKSFSVILKNATGGATLSKRNKCTVTFTSDDEVSEVTNLIIERLQRKADAFNVETGSWQQQFSEALTIQGGVTEDGEEEPIDSSTLLMHYCSVTWKVLFALVPPTKYYGGWLTFWVSLFFIGCVTAVVGEVAAMFGCCLGVADAITAITFVALGTSLPDTFASRQATIEAPDADAAIGNVTGSNSVNVFLGLGFPWLICSVYYRISGDSDGEFTVASGDLSFSVMVFAICASVCLITLLIRRSEKVAGGELGGPVLLKKATACFYFFLWMLYIVLSSLKAE